MQQPHYLQRGMQNPDESPRVPQSDYYLCLRLILRHHPQQLYDRIHTVYDMRNLGLHQGNELAPAHLRRMTVFYR